MDMLEYQFLIFLFMIEITYFPLYLFDQTLLITEFIRVEFSVT